MTDRRENDATGRREELSNPRILPEEQAVDPPDFTDFRGIFRTLLYVVLVCYLVAVPDIVNFTGMEIDEPFSTGELCYHGGQNTSLPGVWLKEDGEDGKSLCKLMIHRIFVFWTISALIYSVYAIPGFYLFRHLRRIYRLGSAVNRAIKVQLWQRFFLNIGLCALFTLIAAVAWIFLDLLAEDAYVQSRLCVRTTPGQELWSYGSGTENLTYCSLRFSDLLYWLRFFSTVTLPVVALTMYLFHLWGVRRQARRRRSHSVGQES